MSEVTPENLSDQVAAGIVPAESDVTLASSASTPPWGDEFDPERAWKTIQNLRAREKELSARRFLTPDDERRLSEFARLEEASQTELERAQKAAEAAAARNQTLLNRAIAAEVKTLASDRFADPSDALAFLGDTSKFVGEGDEINAESIAAALNDLLTAKPHLGKQQAPSLPKPNPAQGASGSAPETGAPQLSADDVRRLYAEKKYDEIEKARQEGRLNNLLGGQD